MMHCSGWRTLMFTLRRRASTMDVMSWAICMRASNSLSTNASSHTGNFARWTEATLSRPVTAIKSM